MFVQSKAETKHAHKNGVAIKQRKAHSETLVQWENGKQFWHVHTKAQIQAKLGDKKGAKETATKSMELAKASPNGDFGYVKRNEDLIASLK